jgi:hypothetical protein
MGVPADPVPDYASGRDRKDDSSERGKAAEGKRGGGTVRAPPQVDQHGSDDQDLESGGDAVYEPDVLGHPGLRAEGDSHRPRDDPRPDDQRGGNRAAQQHPAGWMGEQQACPRDLREAHRYEERPV